MNITHRPVLLAEAVTALISGPLIQKQNAANNILVIDGTFGRGGHTQALLQQLPQSARMISFDKDLDAIAVAQKINDPRLTIVHDSFANMDQYAQAESADGILLDLGISSPQVDEAHRGFSFRREGPLDMRMNTDQGMTAAEWLEQAPQERVLAAVAAAPAVWSVALPGQGQAALQGLQPLQAVQRRMRRAQTTRRPEWMLPLCVPS